MSEENCETFSDLEKLPFEHGSYLQNLRRLVTAVRCRQAADSPSQAGETLKFVDSPDFVSFVSFLAIIMERLMNANVELKDTPLTRLSESVAPLLNDMIGILANSCFVSQKASQMATEHELHKLCASGLTSPVIPAGAKPTCARLLANMCNSSALSDRSPGVQHCVAELCRAPLIKDASAKLLKHVFRAMRYFGGNARSLRLLLNQNCAAAVCSALAHIHVPSEKCATILSDCADSTEDNSSANDNQNRFTCNDETVRQSLIGDCVALLHKLASGSPTIVQNCAQQIARQTGAATVLADIACCQLEGSPSANPGADAWQLLEVLCAESNELCYADRGLLARVLITFHESEGSSKDQVIGILGHFCRPGRASVLIDKGVFDILLNRYSECTASGDDADMRFALTRAFKRLVNDRTALDYLLSWRNGQYLSTVAAALRQRAIEYKNSTRNVPSSSSAIADLCTICGAAQAEAPPLPVQGAAKRARMERTESWDGFDHQMLKTQAERRRAHHSAKSSPTPAACTSPMSPPQHQLPHTRQAFSTSPPNPIHFQSSCYSPPMSSVTPPSDVDTGAMSDTGSGQYSPVVCPSPGSSASGSSLDWHRARHSTYWDSPYHGHSANLWMSDSWCHGDARAGAAYLDAMMLCWMCMFEKRRDVISAHREVVRALLLYVASESVTESRLVRGVEELCSSRRCVPSLVSAGVPLLLADEFCDSLRLPAERRHANMCTSCRARHAVGSGLTHKLVSSAHASLLGMKTSIAAAARQAAAGNPDSMLQLCSLCHVVWSERQRSIYLVGTGYLPELCLYASRLHPPDSFDLESTDVHAFLALFACGAHLKSLDSHFLFQTTSTRDADCTCPHLATSDHEKSEAMVTFRQLDDSGTVVDTLDVSKVTLSEASGFYSGMFSQPDRFRDSGSTTLDFSIVSRCVASHMSTDTDTDTDKDTETDNTNEDLYSSRSWNWVVFKTFVHTIMGGESATCDGCIAKIVSTLDCGDIEVGWRLWLDVFLMAECLLAPGVHGVIAEKLRRCRPGSVDNMAAAVVTLCHVVQKTPAVSSLASTIFANLCKRFSAHQFLAVLRRLHAITNSPHNYYGRFFDLYRAYIILGCRDGKRVNFSLAV